MSEHTQNTDKQKNGTNVIQISEYAEDGQTIKNQALTFMLGGELFAIEVTRVEEIIDEITYTRVPGADEFAPFVINVRGNVIPLIDLRHKFGLPDAERTLDTRTIVFEIYINDEITKVGMTADSVHEVADISTMDMRDMPQIGTKWSLDYVKGITRRDDQVVIVLDIDNIFNFDQPDHSHSKIGSKGENYASDN